ncbi:MAG: hypothetical protein HQL21_00220 [Candidatus Omnitrophica bacterium]|nr:hypothetical protein [Candidatus Omnitrophota bacterium]
MNNEVFLDRLERAYQMEEEMAGTLIDLCHPKALPEDIPVDVRKRIQTILLSIKADTLRHKDIIAEAKKRVSL